ncbi:hypothetical protein OESDEN_02134 [Oesophagostomum dentatum]|uniref:Thrombospondin type 1 domain protein n=1 Tax=Oesophagostomum dentatum TaxID=61180 RepID=A0A0B1TJZ2_OESDE|nr:hypothetical protein OESDEN_02134 [Oesophagostomum dentatum]
MEFIKKKHLRSIYKSTRSCANSGKRSHARIPPEAEHHFENLSNTRRSLIVDNTMLEIILFTISISAVSSSDCELSQWTEWSPCYGTCYFGQIVRNRDVIRPSLPDRPGAPTKRCAHLYETSFCTPASCKVLHEVTGNM